MLDLARERSDQPSQVLMPLGQNQRGSSVRDSLQDVTTD